MSADALVPKTANATVAPTTTPSESKSAKKKKAKAEAVQMASTPPAADTVAKVTSNEEVANGIDATSESPYVRELQK